MDGHLPSKTRNQPILLHYEYEIPFIFPNPGIISSTTTYVYNVSCYIYIYTVELVAVEITFRSKSKNAFLIFLLSRRAEEKRKKFHFIPTDGLFSGMFDSVF